MSYITVISDAGTEVQRDVDESTFGVHVDGEIYYPAATQSIEVESNGNVERTGTQCGDMRQETTATDPYSVTAECIITTEDAAVDNALTLRTALKDIQEGDDVRIASVFPIDKAMEVSNVLVRQESELVSVNTSGTTGEATAFRCQIQLGAEDNEQ